MSSSDPDLIIKHLPVGHNKCPNGGFKVRPKKGRDDAWRYVCQADRKTEAPRRLQVDNNNLRSAGLGSLRPGEYLRSGPLPCSPQYPRGGIVVEGKFGETEFSVTNECPECAGFPQLTSPTPRVRNVSSAPRTGIVWPWEYQCEAPRLDPNGNCRRYCYNSFGGATSVQVDDALCRR